MAIAGRSVSKVLWSASSAAWRLPMGSRASFRVVGSIAGLVCDIGLVAAIVNRIREALGLGVASLSLVAVFAIYLGAWLIISTLLPALAPIRVCRCQDPSSWR
jgi:hypothetical protein